MKNEFEYNWKWALATAIILSFGSCFIFAINSQDYVSPNWEGLFLVIIPLLWITSFLPIWICEIITKVKEKKKEI